MRPKMRGRWSNSCPQPYRTISSFNFNLEASSLKFLNTLQTHQANYTTSSKHTYQTKTQAMNTSKCEKKDKNKNWRGKKKTLKFFKKKLVLEPELTFLKIWDYFLLLYFLFLWVNVSCSAPYETKSKEEVMKFVSSIFKKHLKHSSSLSKCLHEIFERR